MPASRMTWRPARSRTWSTRATSQPARATSARPGSIASRVGRRSAGIAASNAGSSRAKCSGVGDGSPSGRTGKPPPRSTVSNVSIEPRQSAASASALRTASRQASMAPSCDPTCRWMPRGRSGAVRRPAAGLDRLADLRLGHAELRAAGPDRETGQGLGRDVRVDPVQDVDRRRPGAPGGPGQRRRLVHRFEGHPGQRGAIAARPGPPRGGRPAVLPIPSSVMRSFGTPARRARAHSPRETTFAPNPRSATAPITAGTSFALTEYWRTIGSGNAATTDAHAASSAARSVT